MKKLAAVLVLLLVVPGTAAALTTEELVALVAMPLAVAAVSDMAGVPSYELMQVVSSMNRAAVPPAQFIEVVRYVPVALVEEPAFPTYVTRQVDRGVRGQQLAVVMADRLDTYGVREINVVNPPVRYVRQDYIPPMVVTRVEQRRFVDPLALVAMPLAVAAVADITGVPRNDLFSLVTSLNRAAVPAPQFIEIVRYSPAVLVDQRLQPEFISFVDTSIDRGLVGVPLALAIDQRFQTWGVDEIRVLQPVEPRLVLRRERDLIPRTVVTRVAQVSGHPHGGPPGQLKKDLGLQTGAEVVHGTHPSRAGARSAPARTVERSVERDRPGRVDRRDSAKAPKQRAREVRQAPGRESVASERGNRGSSAGARAKRNESLPPPQTSASRESSPKGQGGAKRQDGNSKGSAGKGQGKGKGKGKGGA